MLGLVTGASERLLFSEPIGDLVRGQVAGQQHLVDCLEIEKGSTVICCAMAISKTVSSFVGQASARTSSPLLSSRHDWSLQSIIEAEVAALLNLDSRL